MATKHTETNGDCTYRFPQLDLEDATTTMEETEFRRTNEVLYLMCEYADLERTFCDGCRVLVFENIGQDAVGQALTLDNEKIWVHLDDWDFMADELTIHIPLD